MKRSRLSFALLLLVLIPLTALAEGPTNAAQAARAEIKGMFGFVPGFLDTMPDAALPGAWEEMKTIQMSPSTALPAKIKEAIGLAVAAQIPCKYCTYAHKAFGKLNGATDAELTEAVLMSALTRHWSTVFHGLQIDFAKFRGELNRALEHAKRMAAAGPSAAPKPGAVVDSRTALQDITQSYGMVPEFMQRFPAEGIAGAWKEERDVEMAPTALSGKYKSLISLAVAAQIPCRFCVVADTEFAKLEGASEREISEAVAMAAITRHWSTYLNGMDMDEKAFRKDVDHMVSAAKKMAVAAAKKQAAAAAIAAKAAPAPASAAVAGKTATSTAAAPAAKPAAPAPVAAKPATAAPTTAAIARPATPTPAQAPGAVAPAAIPAAPAGKPATAIAVKPAASPAAAAKPAPAAPAPPQQTQ
jgi:AhpD family alkylhydroperoxidase